MLIKFGSCFYGCASREFDLELRWLASAGFFCTSFGPAEAFAVLGISTCGASSRFDFWRFRRGFGLSTFKEIEASAAV